MRYFLLTCFLSAMFFNSFGQRIKVDTFTNVTAFSPSGPKEGLQEFKNYLVKEYQISKVMDKENLKGKIICSFIVEKDGSFSDIKVLKDLGYDTNKEAIRVLQKYSSNYKWRPRIVGGRSVREVKEIAIVLDL